MLVKHSKPGRCSRVVAHQIHEVDEVALAKEFQGASVGFGAEFVFSEDLTANLDESGFFLTDSRKRFPVSHNIDNGGIQSHGNGFHLMQ